MKKRRSFTLTIVAGTFFLLHVMAIAFAIYSIAAGSMSTEIGLMVLAITAVTSFVLAIVSTRDRIKGFYLPAIILNSILISFDLLVLGLGAIAISNDRIRAETEAEMNNRAGEYATLAYVKAHLPTNNFRLLAYTDGYYTDDNGEIVEYFNSMNFTICEERPDIYSLYSTDFFESSEDIYTTIKAFFYKKADVFVVWAETYSQGAFSPRAHVRGSASTYYSYNHDEGETLFEMMAAKREEQKLAREQEHQR